MVGAAGTAFFVVGLLAAGLIMVGLAVWSLIGMLIMKELSVLEFVLYCSVLLVIVGAGLVTLGSPMMLGSIVLSLVLSISFPWARKWSNDRALLRIEQGDIERHRATIKQRPDIPYSYRRLGEIYYDRKDFQESAKWYTRYLEVADDPTVRQRLKRIQASIEQAEEKTKLCPECHSLSTSEARYCTKCGAILPGPWELIEALRGTPGTRHVVLIAVASLILGVIFSHFRLPVFLPLFCFMVNAGSLVYLLYKRITIY